MSPLVLAIVLYVAFLLFYAVWGLFLLYHLLRFAPYKATALLGSAVFLGVTAALLVVSVAAFAGVDWGAPFALPNLRY